MSRLATWLLAGFLATYALPTLVSAQGNSAAARQAARDRITTRTADRITRQPNPRSSQAARDNFTRRLDRRVERPERPERPEHPARAEQMQRRDFGLSPRENALRRQLAEVDRLRDRALATGNEELLDRANALESQIQTRFQHAEGAPEPLTAELPEEVQLLQEMQFERGLGRETARQVRGLEPLPEVEVGAPGFGRRTAAERRYLRGQEPRGPWDALYRPMPMEPEPPQEPSEPTTEPPTTEPPTTEPPTTEPPTTEPPTTEPISEPSTGVEPLPPIEEPAVTP